MVDYNYKWYIETCKEAEIDPYTRLSRNWLLLAKRNAKKMKYFMDKKELLLAGRLVNTDNEEMIQRISERMEKQIASYNQQRIDCMIQALDDAEKVAGNPDIKAMNDFIDRETRNTLIAEKW